MTIYALTDPNSGEVRYVGQTTNVKARVCQHFSTSPSARCGAWVRRLRAGGRRPNVVILEENPTDGPNAAEARWIAFYLRQNKPRHNIIYLCGE
jgi:hypothetical protein